MKPIVAIFVIGACLLVVVNAFPSSSGGDFDPQPGIPTSLLIEAQQHTLGIQDEQNPLAREKRHKKKVVVVNQYYGQPGYRNGGYGGGCHRCGGYNGGYGGHNGGYGGHNGGYGGHNGGYGGHNGGYGGHNGGYNGGGYGYPDYGYSGGHGGYKKFKG